jgi:hypothetical protein
MRSLGTKRQRPSSIAPALQTCRLGTSQAPPNVIFIQSPRKPFSTRKLHKRLHTHCTRLKLQVALSAEPPNPPTCRVFAEAL